MEESRLAVMVQDLLPNSKDMSFRVHAEEYLGKIPRRFKLIRADNEVR